MRSTESHVSEDVIWTVERPIKGRFHKFVSNSVEIITITNKTAAKTKKDRMKASAFSHFAFSRSDGEFMALDIKVASGVYTDVEIVLAHHAESTFGVGNMGSSSMAKFFEEHECNRVCHSARLERPAGTFGPAFDKQ
uniref:Alpha-type protein kinase domain-containing protein n=1 Tax=Spongospora subterranea TaxID=70186 RepID=A0A0H5RCZ4_9EUKA|eukprot:CRZ11472.1 hypothetical protein [Spongospora subterranea]